MEKIISKTIKNIKVAIEDYDRHTTFHTHLNDISDEFIEKLATDSSYAKQELRELFRKSPAWNEELDAIVINGTRTENRNPEKIKDLARKILIPALDKADSDMLDNIVATINFFANPNVDTEYNVECIKKLSPKAYAPGKKLSRVFKAICQDLGVADEKAGSEFQKLYAQFADELNATKIDFKLYMSINPAHFITMSNPKSDLRGPTLISCHSFNSNEYQYVSGCTGYARDNTSFIVFTAADPNCPETLNNRKTTRQIFAYSKEGNILLQSRMYNTSGGVHGAAEESKLYRDLVQRELSLLENKPNLWKTRNVISDGEVSELIIKDDEFGGYPDWEYGNFETKISVRSQAKVKPLTIGKAGLCIICGDDTSKGLYCCEHDVEYEETQCWECEEYHDTDEMYTVRNAHGDEVEICEYCREEQYTYCDNCNECHHENNIIRTGDSEYVCRDCLENHYSECEYCNEYYPNNTLNPVYTENDEMIYVCESCTEHYQLCDNCYELIDTTQDFCPRCEEEL